MKEVVVLFGDSPLLIPFCLKWEDFQLTKVMNSLYQECLDKAAKVLKKWKKRKLAEIDRDLAFLLATTKYGLRYEDFYPDKILILYKDEIDANELWKVIVNSLGFRYTYEKRSVVTEDFVFMIKFFRKDGTSLSAGSLYIRTTEDLVYYEGKEIKNFLSKVLSAIGAKRIDRVEKHNFGPFLICIDETYRVVDRQSVMRLAKIFLVLCCIEKIKDSFGYLYVKDATNLFSLLLDDKNFLNYVEVAVKVALRDKMIKNLKQMVELIRKTPVEKRTKVFIAMGAVM
ncbi:hypothetical protein DRP04_06120 [Archaeoglobales archaeon]|nr:MAG: hypothetical protein DRP04_06120 [Archaeoglobales archaeon]